MSFPDAEFAIVSDDKLRQYLLNPSHSVGGPKAAWFASLGYTLENADELRTALIEVAKANDVFRSTPSPYGVKYEVVGEIGCPGFHPGRVVTVWMVSGNDRPRLITAHPAG